MDCLKKKISFSGIIKIWLKLRKIQIRIELFKMKSFKEISFVIVIISILIFLIFYQLPIHAKDWSWITFERAEETITDDFDVNRWNYGQKMIPYYIGKTPIMFALKDNDDLRVIEILLKNGANISSGAKTSRAPFYYAIIGNRNLDVHRLLLKYDLKLNEKCFVPPLFYACGSKKYTDLIDFLIENGADINITNNENENALIFLFKRHHIFFELDYEFKVKKIKIVRYLISKGINFNHKDNEGKTALDYAKEKGNEEIIKLLEDAMRKEKPAQVIINTGEVILNK